MLHVLHAKHFPSGYVCSVLSEAVVAVLAVAAGVPIHFTFSVRILQTSKSLTREVECDWLISMFKVWSTPYSIKAWDCSQF